MLEKRKKDRNKKSPADFLSVFIFLILDNTHYFAQQMHTSLTLTLNNTNNFIECLALKAFIINKVSYATKIARFFGFSVWQLFSAPWFLFSMSSEESLTILSKARVNILLQKIFIKKYCYKGLKYSKFMQKRNKAKHIMKKDHCK